MFGISNKKQISRLQQQLTEKSSQIELQAAQISTLQEENAQLRQRIEEESKELHLQQQLLGNFTTLSDSFSELQHSLMHTATNMKDEKVNAIRG
ncbi:MAG: hypothetical protein AB2809_13165, partial [Candidatus Thiodiazotropha sp.]